MKIIITIAIIVLSFNAFAQTLEKFPEGYKLGFRDKATKKVVISAKYTSVEDFVDGIAAVTESPLGSTNMVSETKWKIIDIKGKAISTEEFDMVDLKRNGIAFVYKLNKTEDNPEGYSYGKPNYKVGIIKKDGSYLFPCEYDNILKLGEEHYKIISKEKGIGIIDIKGKTIIEPQQKFDIKEYVGCDLFSYTNKDPNRRVAVLNGVIGGLIDSKQNILLNQDSINFCPSRLINPKEGLDKKNLFGLTGGKSTQIGIYRVGFGLVVPKSYILSTGKTGFNYCLIKPNLIEIYETIGNKLIAKYDWNGKLIYSSH